MRAAVLATLLAAACRFDGGGIAGGDDVPAPDAAPEADADPADPDAAPVPPDAPPPDQDIDGIADAVDNCVAIANTDQHNEDGDARGDVCDNCPHVVNDDQATADGDEVGDVCDPYPSLDGDVIVLFDGFGGSTRAPEWTAAVGVDTWTVGDDTLRQIATTREEKILHYAGLVETLVTVDVAFTPTLIPDGDATDTVRSAGVVTGFSSTGIAAGRVAVVADQIHSAAFAYVMTNALGPGADTGAGGWAYFDAVLGTGRYVLSTSAGSTQQWIGGAEPGGNVVTATQDTAPSPGGIGLRTRNMAVAFEYVVVYGVE